MLFSEFIKKRARIYNEYIAYLEDKVNANLEVDKLGIPVPKLYHVLNEPKNLRDIKLPDSCVIKFNNLAGSKAIAVKKNGSFKGYSSIDEIIDFLNNNNKQGPSCQESVKQIDQKILVEELLLDSSEDSDLQDIKLYCFNGKCEFILLTHNLVENRSWQHYNRNFKRVQIQNRDEEINKTDEKPQYFDEIVKYGDQIASHFCPDTFVRIDFFSTTRGPVFGEFTFNPNGGNDFEKNADVMLGKLLTKNNSIIQKIKQLFTS